MTLPKLYWLPICFVYDVNTITIYQWVCQIYSPTCESYTITYKVNVVCDRFLWMRQKVQQSHMMRVRAKKKAFWIVRKTYCKLVRFHLLYCCMSCFRCQGLFNFDFLPHSHSWLCRAAAATLSGLDLCDNKLKVQTWHTCSYHGLVVQSHGQTWVHPLTLWP